MTVPGIGTWPARRAGMSRDAVALRSPERDLTYGELAERVDQVAAGLAARGVQRGDRVAYLGHNSVALVEVLFAAARLGAVFLPLNTRLAPPETAYVLQDASPSLLLADEGFEALLASPEVSEQGVPVVPVHDGEDGPLAGVVAAGGGARPPAVPVTDDDLVMIQYTSGTSGFPKGVQLSHGNLTWNAINLLVDVDVCHDEVALVMAPLFHTAALNQVLLPTLLKGGTVLVEPRFDAGRLLDLVEAERVTMLFGVTSMFLAVAQHPRFETADLTSLRSALGGGSPFPVALLQTWADRGVAITQGYGLTETSPGATMLRTPDVLRKIGSAGTACFFTEVRVVDPTGDRVAAGGRGEVQVRGPNVTGGYWRNPQATDAAFVAPGTGWLRTGDVAEVDEDGYLRIVDRLKDMFISGGENVYPAEVEQAIYTHPAIAECAVVGVPDERWGEAGAALLVLREGAELDPTDLLAHLRTRLAPYKVPRTARVVQELPHTPSGKLRRADVRRALG